MLRRDRQGWTRLTRTHFLVLSIVPSSPANLSDLLNLLTAEPKARLVGGNTEIGVEVMVRQVRPSVYISTAHVPELHALQHDPGELTRATRRGSCSSFFATTKKIDGRLFFVSHRAPDACDWQCSDVASAGGLFTPVGVHATRRCSCRFLPESRFA